MIDTHAHLNFKMFKNDYAQVIEHNFKQGLKAVINIGSNLETSQKAIKIAQEFKNCFAAIGLHPIHVHPVKSRFTPPQAGQTGISLHPVKSDKVGAKQFNRAGAKLFNRVKDEEFNREEYADLIRKNKNLVKAIGETGLDFYHSEDNKDLSASPAGKQKKVFLQHIELAQEHDLPVILHCRGTKENPNNAYLELLKIIKELKKIPLGVIHCFSSDWEIAQGFLNLGFYIGFTGPITFKNVAPELLQVVEKSPLDRVLLETDCPFLAPEPYRGQRNEPVYVRFMAQKIAEIKDTSFNQVVEKTTKNARDLFKL